MDPSPGLEAGIRDFRKGLNASAFGPEHFTTDDTDATDQPGISVVSVIGGTSTV
jgi:hypothetical protein